MKSIRIIAAILLLTVRLQMHAQTDSVTAGSFQFKLSLNYNSRLNYYGRTDSLNSSAFFPLAEFWLNHFYINAAPVFINNTWQSMQYAGTIATAGYQKISTKWLTNIYLMLPYYRQDVTLPQSALKAQTGSNISFLNKIIDINAGADIKYSDKFDYGMSMGLDHIIRVPFRDNSMVVIDPSVSAYAGTQNFTTSYYQKKNGFLLFPGSQQEVTQNEEQFSILSYEISIPVIYLKNKWQLSVTPAYVLPQHLVLIPGRPDLSERGKNMFYGTMMVKYVF